MFGAKISSCNNHLVKDFTIRYDEIYKVRRIYYLLFIPNRLYIMTKKGEAYTFIAGKRGKLFRAIRQNMDNRPQ